MTQRSDRADWRGIVMRSVNVGGRNPKSKRLRFDGYNYVTEGEVILARLLTDMGVPFTPDVQTVTEDPDHGNREVIFVPDFILNQRAYLWTNEDGTTEIVHGLEAKAARSGRFTRKDLNKVELLRQQRGIHVKLLSIADIKRYERRGSLPLSPLEED